MAHSTAPAVQGGPYAKYVLGVLLLVYVSNQWCRYLLNYLYAVSDSGESDERAKKISIADATGITSAEYGLLVGFGFSFFYVVVGIFMGRAADMYSRKLIIAAGVLIWNIAVVIMASANSFMQVLLSRVLLGIGEAFSAPASYSLIADYFPPESRSEANGIYAFGVYVGGGLGSMSIAMARAMGWRGTCYLVASYGFVLAMLMQFTVREPGRSAAKPPRSTAGGGGLSAGDQKYTLWQSLRVISKDPLIMLIFVAGSIRFMAGYAIGGFLPLYYSNVYPEYNTLYSYLNASVVSIGGALSSFLGGRMADRWEAGGQKRARLYIPAVGALLGVPTFALVVLSRNFYASMFFLFLEYICAECWFGPAISVMQGALHPRVRGVGIACFSFVATMAGSLMSWVLGSILGANSTNTYITSSLIIAVCGSYFVAATIFYYASMWLGMPQETRDELESLLGNQLLMNDDMMEKEGKGASSDAAMYRNEGIQRNGGGGNGAMRWKPPSNTSSSE